MKKMLQAIGSIALMTALAFSASAQNGGKKPKDDPGKRPSEIVRQPKGGNDQGRGGQAPKQNPPQGNNGGGNDRGNERGGKPKKPGDL